MYLKKGSMNKWKGWHVLGGGSMRRWKGWDVLEGRLMREWKGWDELAGKFNEKMERLGVLKSEFNEIMERWLDVLNFLFVLEREESYPTVPLRYLSEKIERLGRT